MTNKNVNILLLAILSLLYCCKNQKFSYETDIQKGKSYIGKFSEYSTELKDSALISGKAFIKRKNDLDVTNAKLTLINQKNDTIIENISFLSGFELKISAGKYRVMLTSDNCIGFDLELLTVKSDKIYLIDFYLQKGQGVSKWFQ